MPETSDPPIIINGGSVNLDFDADQLPPKGKGKHGNQDKTLKSIIIEGDGISYSADFPTGMGVTISVYYETSKGKGKKP
jgi:hypothetical protein